jgi:hypothetical protein
MTEVGGGGQEGDVVELRRRWMARPGKDRYAGCAGSEEWESKGQEAGARGR